MGGGYFHRTLDCLNKRRTGLRSEGLVEGKIDFQRSLDCLKERRTGSKSEGLLEGAKD